MVPDGPTPTHIVTALPSLPHGVEAAIHASARYRIVSPTFVSASIAAGRLVDAGPVITCTSAKTEHATAQRKRKDKEPVFDTIRIYDDGEEVSDAATEPLDEDTTVGESAAPAASFASNSRVLFDTPTKKLHVELLDKDYDSETSRHTSDGDSNASSRESVHRRYEGSNALLLQRKATSLLRSNTPSLSIASASSTPSTLNPKFPPSLVRYVNPTAPTINKNVHITSEFERLVARAEAEGNQWRLRAYRRAVKTLSALDTRITSVDDVDGIVGIGKSMRDKIGEILRTGVARKAHTMPEKFGPVEQFRKIYGVGLRIAEKCAMGFRTIADIEAKAALTRDQKLGLKYYNDFLQRIPRTECTAISDFVCATVKSIDTDLTCRMMGSYLRGSSDCGDADFMITDPHDGGTHPRSGLLRTIVEALTRSGFVVDSLGANPWESGTAHDTIWHGVCRLPGYQFARRIDLLIVPTREAGAATMYFTGNEEFNRGIRLLARKMGYSLSQHGLFRKEADGSKTLVASKTEQEIFDTLGVPWKPPEERNI
ncbi:hypothetical protein HDU83_005667 [Entophlyctis luteolus]|nr:hypothetical protein HDU83_005667 [Entophlyctis luteolus]